MWGISYPGFYTAAGMIDAHPALKAASPQAPVTDWFIGDDWHHNGALFLPHAFNFLADFGRPRPEPTKNGQATLSTTARPTATTFFLRMGPLANADRLYFKDDVAVLERDHAARHLRRVLEGPQHPPAPEGHQAGRDDRRRLVRRREPLRGPRDLQEGRGHQPRRDEHPGDGPLAPRRLGAAATATSLGPVPFNAKTAEYFREQIEFPFFEYHLKGKGRPSFPEAWVFETGTNQWRTFDAWPPREGQAAIALPPRRRAGWRFEPADRRWRREAVRRVRQRPRQAGPVHRRDRDRHDRRVHDPGPAVRRRAGRTCWSTRAPSSEGRPDDRRADPGRRFSSRPPAPTPTGSSS